MVFFFGFFFWVNLVHPNDIDYTCIYVQLCACV